MNVKHFKMETIPEPWYSSVTIGISKSVPAKDFVPVDPTDKEKYSLILKSNDRDKIQIEISEYVYNELKEKFFVDDIEFRDSYIIELDDGKKISCTIDEDGHLSGEVRKWKKSK